jgi:DNA helicase HerA-like ATPase
VIDEAWAVTATASGQKVVEELARMGRSLNVSLVLVSQNAGDFTSSGLVNSISSKFAFRTKTSAEATDVLKLLEVEDSVGNRDMLKGLNNGECLVQDNGGRVSRVQITSWNQDWRLAFDTNPTTKGKAQ